MFSVPKGKPWTNLSLYVLACVIFLSAFKYGPLHTPTYSFLLGLDCFYGWDFLFGIWLDDSCLSSWVYPTTAILCTLRCWLMLYISFPAGLPHRGYASHFTSVYAYPRVTYSKTIQSKPPPFQTRYGSMLREPGTFIGLSSEGIPLVGEAGGELPLLLPRTLYRAHTHFRAQFFDTAWSTSMFCFEKHFHVSDFLACKFYILHNVSVT
jgi:hypothetical protein